MSGPRLAVVMAFSGAGGVERMVVNLLSGFLAEGPPGLSVDLVAIRAGNVPRQRLPDGVRLVDLGVEHSTFAARPLARYLADARPDAVLAAKDRAIRAMVRARRRARVETRLVGRLGTNLTAALAGRGALQRWLRLAPMRRAYRDVDAVIAVSEGVREDTLAVSGLPADRVSVVRNPVVTPDLERLARAPVDHPWLGGDTPVILGAGRLTRQKDFATLLRAFARLRGSRSARLVILGEGRDRDALTALADELGVAADVDLVGHVDNPYAWMARADLFALSSAWEGSPNVLTEALACGTPVVSTDCPSGPRELLGTRDGAGLVPVGDWRALAEAMGRGLDAPMTPAACRALVADYSLTRSARGYLACLGLDPRETD